MKHNIYKELFTLVGKEGERLVVIDPDTDDGVVVMRLSEYKKINSDHKEIVVEKIDEQETEDMPTLAKNETQDLSFWENSSEQDDIKTKELDNKHDSGRIHERKSATTSKKEELELVPEKEEVKEESAGEEYYFEPAEEIGL